jgi:predicted transcriptional regulator
MATSLTIKLEAETKASLDSLKIHPRETNDDVIKRLVEIAIDDEPLAPETLEHLKKAEEDVRAGRVRPMDEVMKELGLD